MKQILGLPVSYSDFQYDDQELYDGKIVFIANNDPSDLDLTFTDHVGGKEILLKPSGNQLSVTESNKSQYLKAFAQHRLRGVSEEHIQSFINGLFFNFNLLILYLYFFLKRFSYYYS